MTVRALALVLATAPSVLTAQHAELKGRVVEAGSQSPIAGARISFSTIAIPATPLPGVKSDYRSTQRLLLARSRLPATVTDRDGEWRILLSPKLAALTTSGLSRLMMTVEAPRHTTWQRCFDGDLRAAALGAAAELQALPETPPLQLKLRSLRRAAKPPRGCVVVERSFRIQRNRTVWIRDVVPIAKDGTCAFDRPVRIPGEPAAVSPVARAEAYRIEVLAAGFEPLITMLPPGEHDLTLEASAWKPRQILAARAQPASGPVRATYAVAGARGGAFELEFDTSAVPLLGDIEPDAIRTGSGPVEVDAWDPDVPMFVADVASSEGEAAAEDAEEPELSGVLAVAVVDARGQPVFGAGVWLERRALRRASTASELFGVSDARGIATLEHLPEGSFSVLVQHPDAGFAESLVDVVPGGAASIEKAKLNAAKVKLRPHRRRSTTEAATTTPPGSILLDLGRAPAEPQRVAVGMFSGDDVVMREFDTHPGDVRLEGLPLAPTGYFVRFGEDPPLFVGDVLPGTAADPAQDPTDIAATTFRIDAQGPDGEAMPIQWLSLGDLPRRDRAPKTSELFTLAKDGATTLCTVHVRGVLWLRAFAEGMAPADVLLDPRAPRDEPISVTFALKPPPPEKKPDPVEEAGPVAPPGKGRL